MTNVFSNMYHTTYPLARPSTPKVDSPWALFLNNNLQAQILIYYIPYKQSKTYETTMTSLQLKFKTDSTVCHNNKLLTFLGTVSS